MKKFGVVLILILILFSFSFVFAQTTANEPSTGVGVGGEDVEKIGNLTKQIPIDPETGELDKAKLANFTSRAETRINVINKWLEDHAAWLKLVFKMKPAISWLFVLNVYFMLLFLMVLVLNVPTPIRILVRNFGMSGAKSKNIARLIGAALWIIFWIVPNSNSSLYKGIASLHTPLFNSWQGGVLIFIIYFITVPIIARWLRKMAILKGKKQEESKEEENRQKLENVVKGIENPKS
jgi:hypothetical protein